MDNLTKLKNAKDRKDFAELLGISLQTLTYCLYRLKTNNQYKTFSIPKKSGGERIINAPYGKLKMIQKKLSEYLQDCEEEINTAYFSMNNTHKKGKENLYRIKNQSLKTKEQTLSHGFERNRSILTNAHMHLGKRNVLNLDLKDFFDCFNFGRVRGFFIKNRNFSLDSTIATLIAQIACYKNSLPQGSPCSPVITNLISHALDVRLAKLARKNSCTYTRYADDITFSTNKRIFPSDIATDENGVIFISKKLSSEINRAGFTINETKTRLQYKDSRQDVTGIIVNKTINTKVEYWKLARAQCNFLFKNGRFFEKNVDEKKEGNINKLAGKLSFINMADYYNRLRQNQNLKIASNKRNENDGAFFNNREKIYQRFLFYMMFHENQFPVILTEGKTDIIHLKAAINALSSKFPLLTLRQNGKNEYSLHFIKYTKKTEFFLRLYENNGCAGLFSFIKNYDSFFSYYRDELPEKPVIIIVDNDSGPNCIASYLNENGKNKEKCNKKNENCKKNILYTIPQTETDARNADCVHIVKNLYIIFLHQKKDDKGIDIESLYTNTDRKREYKGRCFNTVDLRDEQKDLKKADFAEYIVWKNKNVIDFSGFENVLKCIEIAIKDYASYRKKHQLFSNKPLKGQTPTPAAFPRR